jgi:hypothetical protein
MTPTVQYITNPQGEKTSVILTLREWDLFLKRHEELEKKVQFLSELKESITEVNHITKGKKKARSLSKFLNEL